MKPYQVLENGSSIDLSEDEFQKTKHLLYFCDECNLWHIELDYCMDDINELIK